MNVKFLKLVRLAFWKKILLLEFKEGCSHIPRGNHIIHYYKVRLCHLVSAGDMAW